MSSIFEFHGCGNCDYECFQSSELCPRFSDIEYQLIDAIYKSEMAIFVVPNYSDYLCSNFFTFNERSLCCFNGNPELLDRYLWVPKKFLVVSNSQSEHFPEAFCQHTNEEPEVLFLSRNAFGKGGIRDSLLPCPAVEKVLDDFLAK